jgi:hypothetical protein
MGGVFFTPSQAKAASNKQKAFFLVVQICFKKQRSEQTDTKKAKKEVSVKRRKISLERKERAL